MKVTFYQRMSADSEINDIMDCLSSNLETDGFFMRRLQAEFGKRYPRSHALFTTSCTSALEMIMDCLGLESGDEVILPSFNFTSAANAVLRYGARPVLCDIDPETQNLSLRDAACRITGRTKAIVAVHYAGVSCPMDELNSLAHEAGAVLIEDAAQGIGAYYKGCPLGAAADFGAISFHYTKNITCGEGGVMLTGDQAAYERACQYRLHGTNRTKYLRGEVDRYTWTVPGSCTALGELNAALLRSQLEAVEEVTRRRVAAMNLYRELLEPLERRGIARRMVIPDYAAPNGHIVYLRFEEPGRCRMVREKLLEQGIDCKTHYVPLHISPMGRQLGYRPEDLPESELCYRTLLRLPVHTGIGRPEAEFVADRLMTCCDMG